MTCFQMGWRSFMRKPAKSILLSFVVCTISVFLLASMSSKHANIATQDSTRQAIGAGLLLEGNEANRHTRLEEVAKKLGENEGTLDGVHQTKLENAGGTAWQITTDNSFESIKIEDIEKIASISGISEYNITTSTFAVNPINFSRIEDPNVDQSTDVQGVSLIGNRDMNLDFNVLSGKIVIKEGRWIGIEDLDACVISEELAEKNTLKLGDTLQFNDYHDSENATIYGAKIVGIYTQKQAMTPFMSGDTYRSENVIFTDLSFPEKAEGSLGNPLYEKAYFTVADVDAYTTVKETVMETDINWQRYDLIDNNGNLETMSSNFNDLETMSEMLMYVVAGVSFVILSLVFVFWLRSRMQEVGILLSLGMSKCRILRQILLEAIIIAILGTLTSFLLAPAISKFTAEYLVTQQVQQHQEEELSNLGKVATEYQASKQEVKEVKVQVSLEMLIYDGIAMLLLVSISVGSASGSILRRNPKDILSEMS